ncbi:hypothetical protein C84B14_07323 [Salinisphaera sp. C84B14]|uniref:hypothetical protein n=1 Tax=Salinisphaera sp. C84B14 TaxID=1304155 RepID=UPI0033408027
MKLVLVHGINQQGKSENVIRNLWMAALRTSAGQDAGWIDEKVTEVAAPFYGDRLFALSEVKKDWSAVAMGSDDTSDAFAEFAAEAIREMALAAGANDAEIEAEAGETAVAAGAGPHKRWLKAAARVLERHAPWLAPHALKLLGQAHAYLKRPHINQEIKDIVRPALEADEPMVIISHSLGTIVTYELLREFEDAGRSRSCPLYLTLGSPLGIDEVRKSFPRPRKIPGGVARWVNGSDPEDFVALHSRLGPPKYNGDIENIADIENGYDDPHDILQYLLDPRIVAAVKAGFA